VDKRSASSAAKHINLVWWTSNASTKQTAKRIRKTIYTEPKIGDGMSNTCEAETPAVTKKPQAAPTVPTAKQYASEEQLAYARVLDIGMKVGFVLLVATFQLYLTGIVKPYIPHEQLPQYWSMPVGEYLQAADVPTGWGWLSLVGHGDFLNFVGIALLSLVTIACYIAVLLIFLRKKDRVYAALAAVEVLVLVLAASGLLVIAH
jgi:uncharacterized membrane protein